MRRGYVAAFIALLAFAAIAVLVASRVDPAGIGPAVDPDNLPVLAESVPGPTLANGWLNSDPLTAEELIGSVVVYDFWTYSCVNCVRTLPYLRSWYERYRDDGLVIVGVHSPEFEFERDAGNVERAVDDLDVSWPVALDPDMAVWRAFENQYWPAKYIVDREGRLRNVHFGEGLYDQTEDVLRSLLGVDPSSPRADDGGDDTDDDPVRRRDETRETYLGYERGAATSPEPFVDPDDDGQLGGEGEFSLPAPLVDDSFALEGRWRIEGEFVEAAESGAAIVLRYRGTEVNLVLVAPADGDAPAMVRVSVDDGAPRDIALEGSELVNLVDDGEPGVHILRIEASLGVQAFAFTFGSD